MTLSARKEPLTEMYYYYYCYELPGTSGDTAEKTLKKDLKNYALIFISGNTQTCILFNDF